MQECRDASVPVEKPTSGMGIGGGLDRAIHLGNVEVSRGLHPHHLGICLRRMKLHFEGRGGQQQANIQMLIAC